MTRSNCRFVASRQSASNAGRLSRPLAPLTVVAVDLDDLAAHAAGDLA
jgi:hypothetical protein